MGVWGILESFFTWKVSEIAAEAMFFKLNEIELLSVLLLNVRSLVERYQTKWWDGVIARLYDQLIREKLNEYIRGVGIDCKIQIPQPTYFQLPVYLLPSHTTDDFQFILSVFHLFHYCLCFILYYDAWNSKCMCLSNHIWWLMSMYVPKIGEKINRWWTGSFFLSDSPGEGTYNSMQSYEFWFFWLFYALSFVLSSEVR